MTIIGMIIEIIYGILMFGLTVNMKWNVKNSINIKNFHSSDTNHLLFFYLKIKTIYFLILLHLKFYKFFNFYQCFDFIVQKNIIIVILFLLNLIFIKIHILVTFTLNEPNMTQMKNQRKVFPCISQHYQATLLDH